MTSSEATDFLRDIDRNELAELLQTCSYRFVRQEVWFDHVAVTVELTCAPVYAEAIQSLSSDDHERIIDAIVTAEGGPAVTSDRPRDLAIVPQPDRPTSGDSLLPLLIIERSQLIAVATGGTRIQAINDYYKARRKRVAALLKARSIDDPNPFRELWEWFEYWKAHFASYAERRAYIHSLLDPLIDRVSSQPGRAVLPIEPTGWLRVDRGLVKARDSLNVARDEEDFQAVGLLCREILISLAQAVYDSSRHPTLDGVTPSKTDAGRMIEAFIAVELAGGSNEATRAHAKAALKLAVELQHRRTADYRLAALCVEATTSVSAILTVLSGVRELER